MANTLILKGFSAEKAADIVVKVSIPMCVLLAVYGCWSLSAGAFGGILTLVVAYWLAQEANKLHACIGEGRVMQHPLFAAAANVPLAEATPYAPADEVPVTKGGGFDKV